MFRRPRRNDLPAYKVSEGEAPSPAREGACAPQSVMQSVLQKLGLTDDNTGVFDGEWRGGGAKIDKISPIDGQKLASVRTASADEYDRAISRAHEAFLKWRTTPGPVRGDTVRRDRKSTRLNSSHLGISYAVFCLKKK